MNMEPDREVLEDHLSFTGTPCQVPCLLVGGYVGEPQLESTAFTFCLSSAVSIQCSCVAVLESPSKELMDPSRRKKHGACCNGPQRPALLHPQLLDKVVNTCSKAHWETRGRRFASLKKDALDVTHALIQWLFHQKINSHIFPHKPCLLSKALPQIIHISSHTHHALFQ